MIEQSYLYYRWVPNRYHFVQSGPRSNGKEEVLHTHQSSKTEASQSDVI